MKIRLRHSRWLGWTLIALLSSAACAKPVPPRRLVLQVSNRLGREIAEIRKSPCGSPESMALEDSRLAPGETRGYPLPPTCVDLVAYDTRGRIVGQQSELEMLPGATWVLQR